MATAPKKTPTKKAKPASGDVQKKKTKVLTKKTTKPKAVKTKKTALKSPKAPVKKKTAKSHTKKTTTTTKKKETRPSGTDNTVTLPTRVPMRLQEKALVLASSFEKDMYNPAMVVSRVAGGSFVLVGATVTMSALYGSAPICQNCQATVLGYDSVLDGGYAALTIASSRVVTIGMTVLTLGVLLLLLTTKLHTYAPVKEEVTSD